MTGVVADRLVQKLTGGQGIKVSYGKLSTLIFVLTITGMQRLLILFFFL